jgi:purine-binding chemotaxis protein CheW
MSMTFRTELPDGSAFFSIGAWPLSFLPPVVVSCAVEGKAIRMPLVESSVGGEALDVVVFEVAGQLYGLPASDVRELIRAVAIVPLPRAPAVVEGVINLRGTIVPVLDIRARFRLPGKPLHPDDHLIVAFAGEYVVALRADRAVNLVRLDRHDLHEAKGLVPGVEYVSWVARLPNNLVLIHDLRTFLSRGETAELTGALEDAPAGIS